jgi:hypothetical protein
MFKKLFCLLFSVNLILSSKAEGSVNDYIYPNYGHTTSQHGTLGLIQTPSARLNEAGTTTFVFSRTQPYKRGVILANPFDWLEAGYRYVDVAHTPYSNSFEFSGDQTLKDKGFDLKVRLLKETYHFPQIALGLRDLAGTGRFSSEFIVASKKVGNGDYSLGIATGYLGSNANISNPFIKLLGQDFKNRTRKGSRGSAGGEFAPETWFHGEASIFGGVSYVVPYTRGIKFKIEYDSNNYLREGGKPLEKDSDFNFGIEIPISKNNFVFGISYERGNTIGLNLSFSANLSKNFVKKIKPNRQIPKKFQYSKNYNVDSFSIYTNSLKHLRDNNLYLQSMEVSKQDNETSVVFSQPSFYNKPEAITAVFEVLDQTNPQIIEKFSLEEITASFSNYKVVVDREKFRNAIQAHDDYGLKQAIDVTSGSLKPLIDISEFTPELNVPYAHWNLSPAVRNHIGGPDGFYFGQAWLRLDAEIAFTRKIFWKTIAGVSLVDNFDTLKLGSDSVLQHVRTDIVKYLKQGKNNILRSQINFVDKIDNNLFIKLSGGLFEEMFGGFGGEILYRPFAQNYAIGAEIYWAKQRNYEQDFGFQSYETVTGHVNFYYSEPRSKLLFRLAGGKYLAGDSGFTFDIARYFDNGLEIGAYVSQTDISTAEFGEGSFDKGFYLHIPIEVFLPTSAKHRSFFGLRPITRDGAARIFVGSPLYSLTAGHSYLNFDNQEYEYYK